ncbi:MAG TPA: nuclear transport factor 2 family protein [Vicinamibacterales bacterium]|nr:nuclear transport factor 2 family protein [Vicinamibacterales bacterium]
MRIKIFGWIGIVWGTFILVTAGPRIVAGDIGEGSYAAGQYFAFLIGGLMLVAGIRTLRKAPAELQTTTDAENFATRYTKAWCSQRAERVAECYAEHGSLTINGGAPAVGREAIAASAKGFMRAFPDMVVTFDRLVEADDEDAGRATYHWTLIGTNTGPGGTGRPVRISGYEEWLFDADGLILDSQGHFDEAEYNRQLNG